MDDLPEKMSTDQFEQFTISGYFTIRRSEHFRGDNLTDQTIEQELMRLLKTSGGMTHGRGITDSSLMKWVHALSHTIPICDLLEKCTVIYKTMVAQSTLSSAFKLESLLPTSTAAKFHSFGAYHTIQQWLGNELPPDLWGWQNRDATCGSDEYTSYAILWL